MKHTFLQEIVIAIVLILLLIFFINPYMFWMPSGLTTMMIVGLLVVFSIFTSMIWKENPRDEREGLHLVLANRIAYFVGTIALVVGIVFQTINHSVDPWLAITLGLMIMAKIMTVSYAKARK